jgi:aminoglycoside phosphotransferase
MEPLTGTIYRTVRPRQGCNFQVTLLEAERGKFIVKTGDTPEKIAALEDEAKVLSVLTAYRPAVPSFVGRDQDDFLFTFVEGEDLSDILPATTPAERERLVGEYGAFLRGIHAWMPNLPCPADWLTEAVMRCRENVEAGRFGTTFFHDFHPFNGQGTAGIIAYLEAERPYYENAVVFSHGDWCLPNVLARGGAVTAAVDWSAGGYKDYRYDLATALWTLRRNKVSEYTDVFLRGYGYRNTPESLRYFEALYALL